MPTPNVMTLYDLIRALAGGAPIHGAATIRIEQDGVTVSVGRHKNTGGGPRIEELSSLEIDNLICGTYTGLVRFSLAAAAYDPEKSPD